jgi:hypothetical protein
MHTKKHLILIFLLIFTSFLIFKSTTYASASYIEINTKIVSYTIEDNSTNLTVFLNQTGDETAYNIEISPIISEQFLISDSIKKDTLNPGDTMQGNFTVLTNGTLLPGAYPAVILTTYHDANDYPFSVVSKHEIKYKEKYESNIYGAISKLYINEENSGELTLKIRNYDVSTHDIKITLYLPRELKCIKKEITVPVEGIEEQNVKFEIEPFGALKGSTYAVFASLDYEDEYHHYTAFAETTITITEKTQDEQKDYNILFIMIAIFIALIIIYFIISKKGRKN